MMYLLSLQYPRMVKHSWDSGDLADDEIIYKDFQDFSTILKLYDYWENKYTQIFKKIVLGNTYERQNIVILKISGIKTRGYKNPVVFFLGGEAGNDWISSALVLAYMKGLLESRFQPLTKRFDAYFLPLLNPDGYNYSLYKDRFWAKNRKVIYPRIKCHPDIARGVNLDRNWLYKSKGERACGTMYLDNALSENETHNLSNFLDELAPRTLGFFNVKGFDNLITTPYASRDMQQTNIDTIKAILQKTTEDLSVKYNKSYYYGSTRSILFNYTGNCADWVKQNLNVPVVVTFYLKHNENVIPVASDIQPLYYQLTRGVNEILAFTINLYGPLFNSQFRHMKNVMFIFINLFIILNA